MSKSMKHNLRWLLSPHIYKCMQPHPKYDDNISTSHKKSLVSRMKNNFVFCLSVTVQAIIALSGSLCHKVLTHSPTSSYFPLTLQPHTDPLVLCQTQPYLPDFGPLPVPVCLTCFLKGWSTFNFLTGVWVMHRVRSLLLCHYSERQG